MEIISSKVNQAKTLKLLHSLCTTSSQISHSLVLVRWSLNFWGLSRLQSAGSRASSLPTQTCMAWGSWEPAFKAQILMESQKSWLSDRISQLLNSWWNSWWDVGCFFLPKKERKGKWVSAAHRSCGSFLFAFSTVVRLTLRKGWNLSLNIRGGFETLQMRENCKIVPHQKTLKFSFIPLPSIYGGWPIGVRQTSSCS